MNKENIIIKLRDNHSDFWSAASNHEDKNSSTDGKWTVNENVDHINKSISILINFLSTPKPMLESRFGLNGGKSISYEALVEKYHLAIKNGVKSPPPLLPSTDLNHEELIKDGNTLVNDLIHSLNNWSEKELDQYLCPHPALSLISVREVLYFTMYHVEHHHQMIKRISINGFNYENTI
ncbi:DinB family protein [Flavobacterium sp. UMI-01]|uniref:DinB family protein n=1 Tax=Flavobacterium sp. UMI-01 TaxID=1441053 RepID=UPI001C7CD1A5|nr:DinB family protein [Flavobacterium sp. UMI-01]GIZ09053.1 hypothetical protein FUMI01_17800 [Flavobacterium sp. UMI-01]